MKEVKKLTNYPLVQKGTSAWEIQSKGRSVTVDTVQSETMSFDSNGYVSILLSASSVPDDFFDFITSIKNEAILVVKKSHFASMEHADVQMEKTIFINSIHCEFSSTPTDVGSYKIHLIYCMNNQRSD